MREKTCSNCNKTDVVVKACSEEHVRELIVDGRVVNLSVESETGEPQIVITRNCSRGGRTVPGFDKCISKFEFDSKD